MIFKRVGLFIDWNTQLSNAPDELRDSVVERNRFAIRAVGKHVTKTLCSLHPTDVYRVDVRLYHGWTTGFTHTINRRAVAALQEFSDPDSIFTSPRVLAGSAVEFGDRLLDALPQREKKGLGIHLPNTCRKQGRDDAMTEKMVDTALAADLLSWARTDPTSTAFVICSDDDIIPPVFTAESWMKPLGGTVLLTRQRSANDGRFLSLEGLLA